MKRKALKVLTLSILASVLMVSQAMALPNLPKQGNASLSANAYLGEKGVEIEGAYGINKGFALGMEGLFNTDDKTAFGINARYQLTSDVIVKGTILNVEDDTYFGAGLGISKPITKVITGYGMLEGFSGDDSFFRYDAGIAYKLQPGVNLTLGYKGYTLKGLPEGSIAVGISF